MHLMRLSERSLVCAEQECVTHVKEEKKKLKKDILSSVALLDVLVKIYQTRAKEFNVHFLHLTMNRR